MSSVNGPSSLTDNQINNQAFSTQTLVGFVFRDRATLLHDQVTNLSTQIIRTTDNIKELSDLLSSFKKEEAAGTGNISAATNLKDKYPDLKKLTSGNKNYWTANQTIVQGLIDQQTNYSSQLSTQLQNLSNKYNNAFDVVKSFIEDINNDASDIISKIG